MKFRAIDLSDFPQILRIHEECKPAPWSSESVRAEIGLHHPASLLVEGVDGIMGFIFIRSVGDDCEITSMAVRPSAQRKGLGKQLISQALRICSEKNLASRLLLEVSTGNSAAIALYKGFGFESGRVRKSYYSDGSDALEMSLKIT